MQPHRSNSVVNTGAMLSAVGNHQHTHTHVIQPRREKYAHLSIMRTPAQTCPDSTLFRDTPRVRGSSECPGDKTSCPDVVNNPELNAAPDKRMQSARVVAPLSVLRNCNCKRSLNPTQVLNSLRI